MPLVVGDVIQTMWNQFARCHIWKNVIKPVHLSLREDRLFS
jgi:hypothetical protein